MEDYTREEGLKENVPREGGTWFEAINKFYK
jgi:hypothetical protein